MAEKTYTSVEDMVRDTTSDAAVSTSIQKRLARREIVSRLFAIRTAKGLSQSDIAGKMRCSQSRISKLENSSDDELSLGELAGYLDALGMEMGLVVRRKGATLADEVKYHAFSIKRIMDRLAHMANGDSDIAKGVFSFIRDAAFNLERFLNDAATKLLPHMKSAAPLLTLDVEDGEDANGTDEHCGQCGAAS